MTYEYITYTIRRGHPRGRETYKCDQCEAVFHEDGYPGSGAFGNRCRREFFAHVSEKHPDCIVCENPQCCFVAQRSVGCMIHPQQTGGGGASQTPSGGGASQTPSGGGA